MTPLALRIESVAYRGAVAAEAAVAVVLDQMLQEAGR